jgi:hypothetical protein
LRVAASQEQGLANSKFLNVSSLMGAKDTPMTALVDEIIQLWTSTWIADAEHDNAIAENVQTLQRRCMELVRRLIIELQPLKVPELSRAMPKKLGTAASPMGSSGAALVPLEGSLDNGSSR